MRFFREYGMRLFWNLLGSAVLAFGIYNIHSVSGITEGGAVGLTLLLQHCFSFSPAVTNIVITGICYFIGWKTFGRDFLICSAAAVGGFSAFYGLFSLFPPVYPAIGELPLAAAVSGALFVGVGVGLCVRAGGAPTGDDALAMSLSRRTKLPIQRVYLISDLTVLLLSLSYIPLQRIIWSLLTVCLSGQVIGWISRKRNAP